MPVLGALSVTLEVPSVEEGAQFYVDAGLEAALEGRTARLRCKGQDRDSIVLIGGGARKRLHHIALRADGLDVIAAQTPDHGGRLMEAPEGFESNGLWIEDPHGMLIHLQDRPGMQRWRLRRLTRSTGRAASCARAGPPSCQAQATRPPGRSGWGICCCFRPMYPPAWPSSLRRLAWAWPTTPRT